MEEPNTGSQTEEFFGEDNFSLPLDENILRRAVESPAASVTVDMSGLKMVRIDKTRTFLLYVLEDSTWVLVNDSSCSHQYNAETLELEAKLCKSGQYAAYAAVRIPSTAEEQLVESIANFAISESTDDSKGENLIEAIDDVSAAVGAFLQPGDPAVVIETEAFSLSVETSVAGNLEATPSVIGGTAVSLPSGIGSQLNLAPGDKVLKVLTSFAKNPIPTSGSNIDRVISFDLRTNAGKLIVDSLRDPIRIAFGVVLSEEAVGHLETSKSNSTSKVIGSIGLTSDGVTKTSTGVCSYYNETLKEWASDGLETKNEDGATVCLTTHLTAFGIDFRISAPSVSLTNFDPTNSPYLFIMFGSVWALLGVIWLYSWIERRRWDSRQRMIAAGLLEEDPPFDLPPVPPSYGVLRRSLIHIGRFLKTKHGFIASVYPTGRRIYPKRFMTLAVVMAAVSINMGLNAVFAYTASQYSDEKVNTMTINGTVLPMDGIYSFLIMLPLLILLSLSMGVYSAYLDIIKRYSPKKFREAMLVGSRGSLKNNQISDAFDTEMEAGVTGGFNGRRASRWYEDEATENESTYREMAGELPDLANRSSTTVQPSPMMVRRLGTLPETQFFEENQEYNEENEYITVVAVEGDSYGFPRKSLVDVVGVKDELVYGFPVHHVAPSPSESAHMFDKTDLDLQEESGIVLPDEDVDVLIKRMWWWYRVAFASSIFVIIVGFLLTFLWVGSFDTDDQVRWMKSFAEYIVLSSLIASPIFVIIAAIIHARSEHGKQLKALKAMDDEITELETNDENLSGGDKAKMKKQTKKDTKSDTKKDLSDAFKEDIAASIQSQLLNFQVF